jgi:hypothetical protein
MTREELEAKRKALDAEIKALDAEAEAERKTRRESVKREWKFEMVPDAKRSQRWMFDPLWDDTIKVYVLTGTIINKDACLAAGHGEDTVKGGGMAYLFNAGSGKIVTSSGGGNVYINNGSSYGDKNQEAKADALVAIAALGKFLTDNPEGGDVTSIITAQRQFRW